MSKAAPIADWLQASVKGDNRNFAFESALVGRSVGFFVRHAAQQADLVEVGVMAVVTAPDQATANDIAKLLNPYLLHHPLTRDEEQPTFAFPFSPAEIDRGAAYEFCLNHVMTLADPMDAFTLEVRDV